MIAKFRQNAVLLELILIVSLLFAFPTSRLQAKDQTLSEATLYVQ
jgi:hypothetical protein